MAKVSVKEMREEIAAQIVLARAVYDQRVAAGRATEDEANQSLRRLDAIDRTLALFEEFEEDTRTFFEACLTIKREAANSKAARMVAAQFPGARVSTVRRRR